MSINDPITIEYNEKRGKYYLLQGRETFYDENNEWIMFDTLEDAIEAQVIYTEVNKEMKND